MKRQHISAIGIFGVVMVLVMGSHACSSRRDPPPRKPRPVTQKPTITLTTKSSQPTERQKSKNMLDNTITI